MLDLIHDCSDFTLSFSRFEATPLSPAQLFTMCRDHQQTQDTIILQQLSKMDVIHYERVTEVSSQSSLPHSHWLCWGAVGLSALLARLQKGDTSLVREDLDPVVDLARTTITVSLRAADLLQQFTHLTQQESQNAVTLARAYQVHQCTPHCTSSYPPGQKCSQFFPKLPSLFHLQSRRPDLASDAKKRGFTGLWGLHERIQQLLRQLPHPGALGQDPVQSLLALLRQLDSHPVFLESGDYEWAGLKIRQSRELERLLDEVLALEPATVGDQVLLALYHQTLLYRRHAKLLPACRVSEVWVVQYNPELLLATQANMEINLVTHTVPTLLDYMSKGATSQAIPSTVEQLNSWGGARNHSMAEQLRLAWEEEWREVSLTEAFYVIYSELHLSAMDSVVSWIGLEPPDAMVALYVLRCVCCYFTRPNSAHIHLSGQPSFPSPHCSSTTVGTA